MSQLKPCPFCGNEAPLGSILLQRYHIFCARCQARGPEGKTLEAASAAWNRRLVELVVDVAAKPSAFDEYAKWLRGAVTVEDVDGIMSRAESDQKLGKLTLEELDRLATIAEGMEADMEGRAWV